MVENHIKIETKQSPEKGRPGDFKGGNDISITHSSVIIFSQDTILEGQTYNSSGNNEHAIQVTGGNVDITNSNITKTGNADGDSADFYGTNAAAISTNGQLGLHNVSINTNGKHANAVFAYGSGNVFIADSTVTTKNDNSGGIMVTGGGTLSAENLTITTEGNSSAAIRSDRGGGEIQVEWGEYTTNGIGSPVIYSTADITISHANLTANKSEGAIIEGKNSITISNSTLTDSNTTLNGKSSTYKNIFIYQSMSGDANEGTGKFTAIESKIITNNGDTIYVTNTNAEIVLQNNEIINKNGDFLRIEGAARGKEGSNGGDVTLNLINQEIKGDIIIDEISSLNMTLTEGSNFIGAINSSNESQNISVKLDNNSTWTLTSDSYISEISSDSEGYSNINLNGYTLYIGENIINSVDEIPAEEQHITTVELIKNPESPINNQNINKLLLGGISIILIIIIFVLRIFIKKRKKNNTN